MRVRVTRLRVSYSPYSFLVFHPHYGNMAPRTRPDTLQPIVLLRRRRAQDHAERRGGAPLLARRPLAERKAHRHRRGDLFLLATTAYGGYTGRCVVGRGRG
eukprot:scaffold17322_cov57-Phaeocystis_antarctica.AAC.1